MEKYSVSEENYLKAIYHLQQSGGNVTTNDLAAELKSKPASITDMMKKLKTKNLVHYERYQGFRLTEAGQRLALMIVRRHRLWEFFLVEKLQFTWDEVHELAEELEHVTSTRLVDRLDAFLGFPQTDPHGDPIPDREGNMVETCQLSLAELPEGAQAQVCSVADQSTEMLDLLTHHQIGIGTIVQLVRRFSYDASVQVQVLPFSAEVKRSTANNKEGKSKLDAHDSAAPLAFTLSAVVAQKLNVRPITGAAIRKQDEKK
jgi:DtxR family Mn-dependent transcriptional regulator